MIKQTLLMPFLLFTLGGCQEKNFVMDYDKNGQLEQWSIHADDAFISKELGIISLDKLINSLASSSYQRIQQLTYCAQINDTTLDILSCDEDSLSTAFNDLSAMQSAAYPVFQHYPLSIKVNGEKIRVNALSQSDLVHTLHAQDIAFDEAEKALVLYLLLGQWMEKDPATGLAQALSIYHSHKNKYHIDETGLCDQAEEKKALHAWLLGSYLYARDIPLRINYSDDSSNALFFQQFIDARDPWSFVMDTIISRSILFEDLYFRLPAKMIVNTAGEAIIYRLHKNVTAAGIDLKIGDKVLGFNGYNVKQDTPDKQQQEIIKAMKGDKKFHWKIARADKIFTVTTSAKNEPAPIEDSLIIDIFKQQQQQLHYLKLEAFVEGFERPIAEALKELSQQSADTLIIDLRNNNGGSNALLLYMLQTLFADENSLLNLMVRENGLLHNSPIELNTKTQATTYQHYYILLNESSVSASEQFAHAVQHRADVTILANSNSYGKRVSSHIWQGNCGKSYQLTTSFAINGLGKLIPLAGVSPDIIITESDKNLFYTHPQDPFIAKVLELNARREKDQALKRESAP